MRRKTLLLLLPASLIVVAASCSDAPAPEATREVRTAAAREPAAADLRRVELRVPNMVCSLCANTITNRLEELGVDDIRIDLESKRVEARFDRERMSAERIRTEVEDLGYTVAEVRVD